MGCYLLTHTWFYYITAVIFSQDFLGNSKIFYHNPSQARLSQYLSPVKLHWQKNGADRNLPICSTYLYLPCHISFSTRFHLRDDKHVILTFNHHRIPFFKSELFQPQAFISGLLRLILLSLNHQQRHKNICQFPLL